jgi:hypothetical protein
MERSEAVVELLINGRKGAVRGSLKKYNFLSG